MVRAHNGSLGQLQNIYTPSRAIRSQHLEPQPGKPAKERKPENPREPKGGRKKIVAGVLVVAVLVVALGVDLSGSLSVKPLPSSVANAPLCSTDLNATLPCGMAAGSEGNFVLTAANIVLSKSDPGAGNLSLTIYHTGLYAGTEIYAQISPYGFNSYVQVLRVQAVGESSNYTAVVPSSFGLVSGQRYQLKLTSLLLGQAQGQVVEQLDYALTANTA
jgi:hypothetical protein